MFCYIFFLCYYYVLLFFVFLFGVLYVCCYVYIYVYLYIYICVCVRVLLFLLCCFICFYVFLYVCMCIYILIYVITMFCCFACVLYDFKCFCCMYIYIYIYFFFYCFVIIVCTHFFLPPPHQELASRLFQGSTLLTTYFVQFLSMSKLLFNNKNKLGVKNLACVGGVQAPPMGERVPRPMATLHMPSGKRWVD